MRSDQRQADLFPDLAPQPRPARPRPPTLYAAAAKRRRTIERMTLKGCRVREIAGAARCTITHVLRIRAELRAEGRLPKTPRTM